MRKDIEQKRHNVVRTTIALWMMASSLQVLALTPCTNASNWYEKVSYSPDVRVGEWNGRTRESLDLARKTGYLMLWIIGARVDTSSAMNKFIGKNIGRQAFCDVVNNYGNIILCYDEYSTARDIKNGIYQYRNGSSRSQNKHPNGYAVWHNGCGDGGGWADPPPSIHLLRVDSSTNVVFHMACQTSGGSVKYETEFSPYADSIPLPNAMLFVDDQFAPVLQKYLDLFPTVRTSTAPQTHDVVDVHTFILHRQNIIFRQNVLVKDILVKEYLDNSYSPIGGLGVRLSNGTWFRDYDDKIRVVADNGNDIDLRLSMITNRTVTWQSNVPVTIRQYQTAMTTNVSTDAISAADGNTYTITETNVSMSAVGGAISVTNIPANVGHETYMRSNYVYRIGWAGDATVDIFD